MLDELTQVEEAIASSKRERDDDYHKVVFAGEDIRIIECRDSIQWILQSRTQNTLRTDGWKALGYFTSRKALIKVWHAKTGDYQSSVELSKLLPKWIGGAYGA